MDTDVGELADTAHVSVEKDSLHRNAQRNGRDDKAMYIRARYLHLTQNMGNGLKWTH